MRKGLVKVDKASAHIRGFLEALSVPVDNPHLKDTPDRVARAFNEHFLSGYDLSPRQVLTTEFEEEGYNDLLLLKDIPFYSLCAHHLIPFWGHAHVAYIPSGKIVGLSKFARLVDAFAKRLQVQERLTNEIAHAIEDVLHPVAVGVVIEARHLCIEARGVQKPGIETVTSCMLGAFLKEPVARAELMALINSK